jgi:hypothetical protein
LANGGRGLILPDFRRLRSRSAAAFRARRVTGMMRRLRSRRNRSLRKRQRDHPAPGPDSSVGIGSALARSGRPARWIQYPKIQPGNPPGHGCALFPEWPTAFLATQWLPLPRPVPLAEAPQRLRQLHDSPRLVVIAPRVAVEIIGPRPLCGPFCTGRCNVLPEAANSRANYSTNYLSDIGLTQKRAVRL